MSLEKELPELYAAIKERYPDCEVLEFHVLTKDGILEADEVPKEHDEKLADAIRNAIDWTPSFIN